MMFNFFCRSQNKQGSFISSQRGKTQYYVKCLRKKTTKKVLLLHLQVGVTSGLNKTGQERWGHSADRFLSLGYC